MAIYYMNNAHGVVLFVVVTQSCVAGPSVGSLIQGQYDWPSTSGVTMHYMDEIIMRLTALNKTQLNEKSVHISVDLVHVSN